MSFLNAKLPWLNAAGTVLQSGSQIFGGIAGQRSANAEARQLRQRANAERVTSQYKAREERRQARYAASRGMAVAAASGGGTADPSVVNTIADVQAEGEYRALMALRDGEDTARGYETAARARSNEGQATLLSGLTQGATTAFEGYTDWFEKYGKKKDELAPVTVSSRYKYNFTMPKVV